MIWILHLQRPGNTEQRDNKLLGSSWQMKKINTIIAACDMSMYSNLVIAYAAELADNIHAQLVIINVINQKTMNVTVEAKNKLALSDNRLTVSVDEYISNLKAERLKEMKGIFKDVCQEHLRARIVFKVGVPYQKLLAAVQEENADMIVMGTKGRTSLSEVLFGSTAEKMFEFCPVPILSVRLQED